MNLKNTWHILGYNAVQCFSHFHIKYKYYLYAFAGYCILCLIFTLPVAFSLHEITGRNDVYQFIWYFWWFNKAILSHATPFFTHSLYYPSGVSLVFSSSVPFFSVISIPLQSLFGLVPVYNLIWLSTFVLSGFGAFLLVYYLVKDALSAFVSGIIFMFSPYAFAHAIGHLNLLALGFIPLYILFLFRTIREKSLLNPVFAGIFLVILVLCDYYNFIFAILFTLIFFVYHLWSEFRHMLSRDTLCRIGIAIASFGILIIPFAYIIVQELLKLGTGYLYGGGYVEFSADLLAFFIPSRLHPLFGPLVKPVYAHFTGNIAEFTVFMGYTALFLALMGIVKTAVRETRLWIISLVIFFMLCLGPVLHVYGTYTFLIENYHPAGVILPYIILMKIPLFNLVRAPSRWDVLVMLSLSVLAGYGLRYIFQKYADKSGRLFSKKQVIAIVVSALILFEFLSVPYPMTDASVPDFYHQLARSPGDYAIYEIPDVHNGIYMFYQTVHGKNLVNGYVSRTPDQAKMFLYALHGEDILNQNLTDLWSSAFRYYNIRYIILHPDEMSHQSYISISRLLNESIGQSPIEFDEDHLVVYEVTGEPPAFFMMLGNGWNNIEVGESTVSRWMKGDASLLMYAPEECSGTLSFQAWSFHKPRTLDVILNDERIARITIPTDGAIVRGPVHLSEGDNIIHLQVMEGGERPVDLPELDNPDTRELSLYIRNISFENGVNG